MQVPAIVEFAESLVDLADHHGFTPVVACDRSVRLSNSFYVHLLRELAVKADRPIRVEVFSDEAISWWNNWTIARFVRMLESCAKREQQLRVSVERRLMLSRPAGAMRPLAIGMILHPATLPEWARLIELTARPKHTSQIQIVAA